MAECREGESVDPTGEPLTAVEVEVAAAVDGAAEVDVVAVALVAAPVVEVVGGPGPVEGSAAGEAPEGRGSGRGLGPGVWSGVDSEEGPRRLWWPGGPTYSLEVGSEDEVEEMEGLKDLDAAKGCGWLGWSEGTWPAGIVGGGGGGGG